MKPEVPHLAIRESLKLIQSDPIYELPTKRYRDNYLSNQEANSIRWEEFKQRANSLHTAHLPHTNLEVLVVPKSRSWSEQDVNIYFGSDQQELRAIQDLSEADFTSIFKWQIQLARQLADFYKSNVNIAHGFNPEDTAPDAHSIRNKFHTHVYIPDKQHRQLIQVDSLDWFDKLKLIEPYAHIFNDFVLYTFQQDDLSDLGILQLKEGFFSINSSLEVMAEEEAYFNKLYNLLQNIQWQYETVVNAYTAGDTETHTGHFRFIPLPIDERMKRIEDYMKLNADWLSEKSKKLLVGLGANLISAEPRLTPQSIAINNSSQLWIAKGFSGAMNFAVSTADDFLRFDFAPRVISTSGATKFITDERTIVFKDVDPAAPDEIEKLMEYENKVVEICKQTIL